MTTEPNDERESQPPRHSTLENLVARHLPLLQRYVRVQASPFLRSREPVADIVQSTVREIIEAADGIVFDGDVAFRRYLYAVATNKIISKNRYHRAERRNPEREEFLSRGIWDVPHSTDSAIAPSPSRHAERSEDLERLRAAFGSLSEEDRRILSMRRIFDIPTAEIAAELGLAESTVRWRLARILAQLASRLGAP